MDRKRWDSYASVYHDYIISPLNKDVENPLISEVRRDDSSNNLVVADIGTGIGDLLPLLSKNFKKVYAIDFSDEMLKLAKSKNKEYDNILFRKKDIRKLTSLGINIDVAIAVNSILSPSFKDVDKSFSEIYATLNREGKLMAIFPAMEATLHYFMLIYEKEYGKLRNEKKALSQAKRQGERSKYDLIRCTYEDAHGKQKLYYRFELKNRLKKAGFKNICIKKVFYPWEDNGDFKSFEGKPKMWDWYVTARK